MVKKVKAKKAIVQRILEERERFAFLVIAIKGIHSEPKNLAAFGSGDARR